MFAGGALSLSDRRLRVGAPQPAKRKSALRPAGRMMRRIILLVFALLLSAPASSWAAVQPDEMLQNQELEARARTLSQQLRCMVCQNESIDESDAPLAHDLRVLVRERLQAGDSDAQVLDFLVARYGEFVLLKPRLSWRTAILWGLPPGLLLGGIALLVVAAARRRGRVQEPAPNLTAAEELRLKKILADNGGP